MRLVSLLFAHWTYLRSTLRHWIMMMMGGAS